jgi:outer membrane protein assembly factor BamD (BamD/ComL family)
MRNGISFILISVLIFAISCSKNMSEVDYYTKANELMSQEQWEEAEQNFQSIIDKYPDGEYSAKAVFMIGFINANYTNNLEKAKEYYHKFLEKYPNHDLADDARYELENLGKSIDDLPFLKGEPEEGDDTKGGEKVSAKSSI